MKRLAAVALTALALEAVAQEATVPAAPSSDAARKPATWLAPPLGMVQPAWRDPQAHLGKGQEEAGYKRYEYSHGRTYVVRVRLGNLTRVVVDPGEWIHRVDVGDPASLEVTLPNANSVVIRPLNAGTDSSVDLNTEGRVYQLQVIAESLETQTITDRRVDINLAKSAAAPETPAEPRAGGTVYAPDAPSRNAAEETTRLHTLARDGVDGIAVGDAFGNLRAVQFDPATVEGGGVVALGTENAERIKPDRVWRDERWTYLDYGERAKAMNDWPAVLRLSGEVENMVDTTVAGEEGQVLVVKARGRLVLRDGQDFVCIWFHADGREGEGPPPTARPGPTRQSEAGAPTPLVRRTPGAPGPGRRSASTPLAGGAAAAHPDAAWRIWVDGWTEDEQQAAAARTVRGRVLSDATGTLGLGRLAGAEAARLCGAEQAAGRACRLER